MWKLLKNSQVVSSIYGERWSHGSLEHVQLGAVKFVYSDKATNMVSIFTLFTIAIQKFKNFVKKSLSYSQIIYPNTIKIYLMQGCINRGDLVRPRSHLNFEIP